MPNNFAGISEREHISRYIFGDDRTCADRRIVTDGNAGENDATAANPYVIANFNRRGGGVIDGSAVGFIPILFNAITRLQRMIRRINLHIRGNQPVFSDGNAIAIQNVALKLINVLSPIKIFSP